MTSRLSSKTLILLAALASTAAQAQTARVYGVDDDRYSICEVDEGWLRLNRTTGQVALCWPEGDHWFCEPLPANSPDAAKYEAEIARLRSDLAGVRQNLARLRPRILTVPDDDATGAVAPVASAVPQAAPPVSPQPAPARPTPQAEATPPKDAAPRQLAAPQPAAPSPVEMPSAQAAKPLPPQELSQADTPPPADTSPPAAPQARVEKPSFFPEPLIAVERAWQSLLDIMSKLQAELRKRP